MGDMKIESGRRPRITVAQLKQLSQVAPMTASEELEVALAELEKQLRPHPGGGYQVMMGLRYLIDADRKATTSALEDMLETLRVEHRLIADSLGVPYEPHQTYTDRILDTAAQSMTTRAKANELKYNIRRDLKTLMLDVRAAAPSGYQTYDRLTFDRIISRIELMGERVGMTPADFPKIGVSLKSVTVNKGHTVRRWIAKLRQLFPGATK